MRTKPSAPARKSVAAIAPPLSTSEAARLAGSNSAPRSGSAADRHQMQIRRNQMRPRLWQAAHAMRQGAGRWQERRRLRARQLPAIGGELAVLLPAQAGFAEADAVMLGVVERSRHTTLGAETGECHAVGRRLAGIGHEGEVQKPPRRLQRREGPGMDLREDGTALRMRNERRRIVETAGRHAPPLRSGSAPSPTGSLRHRGAGCQPHAPPQPEARSLLSRSGQPIS